MRGSITVGALVTAAVLGLAGVGHGHHLGVYVPQDDEITASYKRLKVFLEKRRADLAEREFEEDGWVRRRMAEVDAGYRATLVVDMKRALAAGDVLDAHRALVRFFCFIAREKAQEALDRLGSAGLSIEQKSDQGVKLLAAGWRYYNLVDFRVVRAAPKIATEAKVVFENAEYYLGKSSKGLQAFDEAKTREALTRFRDLMTEFLGLPAPAGPEAHRP